MRATPRSSTSFCRLKGFDGLAALAQTTLAQAPFSGHVFVFRGRRGDIVKLLWYDDQGLCLFASQRGEAENRIKEAQVGLFATRTSCHVFASNQLRVLLAALDYVLIERLRALAQQGTALATEQVDTLRIKLLTVAAVFTRNTRRIR